MQLGHCHTFINNALDVCNWPIEMINPTLGYESISSIDMWNHEKIKECIRIFNEEYIPGCKTLSYIVDETNFQHYKLFTVDNANNIVDAIITNDKTITEQIWDIIRNGQWSNDDNLQTFTFMVKDSIHDIGYVEDLFPFTESVNEFGEPYASPVEFYRKWLPSMMKLVKNF